MQQLSISLYNRITRSKEEISHEYNKPKTIYVCGPTVYNLVHIGNGRTLFVFDLLYRLLKLAYGEVTYIRNITDVDDKIISHARERNITPRELAEEFTDKFNIDMRSFKLLDPTFSPKVFDNIEQIILFIQKLIDLDIAYVIENNVLFDVTKFPPYGILSNRTLDDESFHRIEPYEFKKNTQDFFLWKSSDDDYSWQSPWGIGRPGWHIECTVMRNNIAPGHCDIHAGGMDLIFPHHENDIAQTYAENCCIDLNKTLKEIKSEIWVHTGMLLHNGVKMSKSLGNIITLRDAINELGPYTVKLAMLMSHYSSSLDWNNNLIKQAQVLANKISRIITKEQRELQQNYNIMDLYSPALSCLCNDLDSPGFIREINKLCDDILEKRSNQDSQLFNTLAALGLITSNMVSEQALNLIKLRQEARIKKDHIASDLLRQQLLLEYNLNIIDERDGSYTIQLNKI